MRWSWGLLSQETILRLLDDFFLDMVGLFDKAPQECSIAEEIDQPGSPFRKFVDLVESQSRKGNASLRPRYHQTLIDIRLHFCPSEWQEVVSDGNPLVQLFQFVGSEFLLQL